MSYLMIAFGHCGNTDDAFFYFCLHDDDDSSRITDMQALPLKREQKNGPTIRL